MDCLFCDIISGKQPGFFIYEDENFVAILDKYPIDDGHSLVLTKKLNYSMHHVLTVKVQML